ncbi:glycosyl transferase group 1 [Denitrovibrio acetiphilus DSM 12809]|uniref:Glycosyl transferase group 1 n=1 Tax=Denitrovibrio acetiphilus (strain DSM 12809 / NBRC 114555 / N2460) TaxID=522772 RepID=D4H5V1_DENA2|nr:glycosyltransferase family 1 protein [Denitrovibrio acetiphilus]ADD69542.1 glycosyl transferase group 1 [Denitrovibrio acetiphilus DSM 12809]
MKLCYDNIIYYLQNSGGISKYWYELTNRLITTEDISFIEYDKSCNNFFRNELNIPIGSVKYDKVRILKFARYLPVFNPIEKDCLFHSSYYRVPLDNKVKTIVTIHDFTYEYFFSGLRKQVHSWQKRKAIKRADRIICISKSTKQDLLMFYPDIDPDSIDVVYNGVNKEFSPISFEKEELKKAFGLNADVEYAVFVGSRSFYKNYNIAVEASALAGLGLIIVGGGSFSSAEKDLTERYLKGKYLHIDKAVSTDILNKIYNLSYCLLYPSSYEGFGIPAAEAINAECIPIVLNKSSLPEVVDDAGLLCDAPTAHCFAEKIGLLADNNNKVQILSKCHQQRNRFSWDKCCSETIKSYSRVYL